MTLIVKGSAIRIPEAQVFLRYVTKNELLWGDFLQLFLFQLQLKFFFQVRLILEKMLKRFCPWADPAPSLCVNSLLETQSESSREGCGSSSPSPLRPSPKCFYDSSPPAVSFSSVKVTFYILQCSYIYTFFLFELEETHQGPRVSTMCTNKKVRALVFIQYVRICQNKVDWKCA